MTDVAKMQGWEKKGRLDPRPSEGVLLGFGGEHIGTRGDKGQRVVGARDILSAWRSNAGRRAFMLRA
jgi:hypothetical protein